MPKRTSTRRTCRPNPRAGQRRAVPGLSGPRHLAALTGLMSPQPLDPAREPVVDHDCVMPPEDVARTWHGAVAVLTGIGRTDLLRCEVLAGLGRAARLGYGLSLPQHAAKALWRFCDAYQDDQPALAPAARGLRVLAV